MMGHFDLSVSPDIDMRDTQAFLVAFKASRVEQRIKTFVTKEEIVRVMPTYKLFRK